MILQAIRPVAQAGNKTLELNPLALFAFFISRCRENLHVVVAFSPIGIAFRNRLRQFPSLINCCTIDWFQVLWNYNEATIYSILCIKYIESHFTVKINMCMT